MKKAILILCIVAIAVAPAFAKDKGHLSFNAKMELYNPPGDDLIAPMFTVQARYRMSAFLAVVGNASWTQYKISGNSVTFVPVAIDGELHPLGRKTFDPYIGVGLGANYRQEESLDPNLDIGANLFGGLIWNPEGHFGVDVSFKYRVEDIVNPGDTGSWTVGGGVTGSWEKNL